ncbi:MAG: leucine-rich repeat domain-containing protein [Lachnospiraceae bacterium]|nr:leucine-rich repeat domain-containing protein [Lachnospiraceae bacterium]
MALQYEVKESRIGGRQETSLEVTGYDGEVSYLYIPDSAQGLPVRSIGAHAFERRQDLTEVVIPDGVRTLRAFAFHNCRKLRKITMTDSVIDVYDGAARHCDSLKTLEITMHAGQYAGVKTLLSDCDATLRLVLTLPEGETVRLLFPSYNHFYDEDPWARVIHAHIDGSGMAFRESVSRSGIDYAAYDKAFEYACVDGAQAAGEVALDRLMTPKDLSDRAREQYEAYVRQNAAAILKQLVTGEREEELRFLTGRAGDLLDHEAVSSVLSAAADAGNARITALLMEAGRRTAPPEDLFVF